MRKRTKRQRSSPTTAGESVPKKTRSLKVSKQPLQQTKVTENPAPMASAPPLTEMEQEATCSICLDYLRDPVVLECGHSFCQSCIKKHCETWEALEETLKCPTCQVRFQKGDFRPNWQLANLVEKVKLMSLSSGKEDLCLRHKEKLHFFCKEDEKMVCFACEQSPEHQEHTILIQQHKDQLCKCLELLKKERERIEVYKGEVKKESQDLFKQTGREKQWTVARFRQLHVFLEDQEKLLLAQTEEVEKEVAKKRDQCLAELSEELSALESLIQEMEEKCQQSAGDLLQDVRSTLQRYEEKETFEKPVPFTLALKWRIWDFCDINHFLEGVMKQLKDTLEAGFHLQKANVTLDPNTAHPLLIVSEDRKSVRQGEKFQALPDNPERFDRRPYVLGCEGFTAGRHFWEVSVGSEKAWTVGVARKSVRRKGDIAISPEEGFWEVGKWDGSYTANIKGLCPPLTLSGELRRIRVCLNYPGGRVAFFDADRAALLYEFCGASFSGESLLPCFWVRLKGHLQLS